MVDSTKLQATPAAGKKGKSTGKAKNPKPAPSHPKVEEMVNAAIGTLKEKGGSSLQAIKKYVGAHYKVDSEKMAPFIRRYLKSSVEKGTLIQTKGKGASGSFRLGATAAKGKKEATKKKPTTAGKKPKTVEKKKVPAKPKKPAAPKKAAEKKPAASKKATGKPAVPEKAKKTPAAPKKTAPKAIKPKKSAAKPMKSPAKKVKK